MPGVSSAAKLDALAPGLPVTVMLGRRAAIATPTWALAECMNASAALSIRTLPHQRAGQAHRQVRRQRETPEIESLQNLVGRELAGQRSQQVALHRELLVQRRQGLLGLSENRFLCQNVDLRRIAIAELGLENIEDIALDLDDALVAAIWPRSAPSWIAAVTTLVVSARYAASSWNCCCSVWASRLSTLRMFEPQMSGTNEMFSCAVCRVYRVAASATIQRAGGEFVALESC